VTTFRRLVASEKPLVLPGAHDAISARLIQLAVRPTSLEVSRSLALAMAFPISG
jgi:2-methylisocitrate lyase-like PEP mutase family enzyme